VLGDCLQERFENLIARSKLIRVCLKQQTLLKHRFSDEGNGIDFKTKGVDSDSEEAIQPPQKRSMLHISKSFSYFIRNFISGWSCCMRVATRSFCMLLQVGFANGTCAHVESFFTAGHKHQQYTERLIL
jgi:hypothetical protein